MDIFVYSDESGVFDPIHNEYFVFSGVICFSKDERDNCSRKYLGLENVLRNRAGYSINNTYKFAAIINQKRINENITINKKNKQRYLDYAFKMGLKNALQILINKGIIKKEEVKNIYVFCDEHSTATDGRYELREGLFQEFKIGTFNWNYNKHFKPLFEDMESVNVEFLCSKKKPLIRAADIIANRIYFHCNRNEFDKIKNIKNLFVKYLP